MKKQQVLFANKLTPEQVIKIKELMSWAEVGFTYSEKESYIYFDENIPHYRLLDVGEIIGYTNKSICENLSLARNVDYKFLSNFDKYINSLNKK